MSKKPLILIVDDNPVNIQVLASLIAIKNYDIAVANSGERTLQFLKQRLPDLILMDIMMPGMSGIETSVQIKKNPEWDDIPLLFISARNDEDTILSGFEAGGVDYITKPFLSLELMARIETHLELVKAKRQLQKLSYTDDLTKAKNRRYFTEYLDNIIDNVLPRGGVSTVILFDIDDFKNINDTYGHGVGDLVLRHLTTLCEEMVMEQDGKFCRLGGDEFAFVINHLDKMEITNFVDKLFKIIEERSAIESAGSPKFSISAGVTAITGRQRDHVAVLAKVDKALYRSKEKGKNCFCFT